MTGILQELLDQHDGCSEVKCAKSELMKSKLKCRQVCKDVCHTLGSCKKCIHFENTIGSCGISGKYSK